MENGGTLKNFMDLDAWKEGHHLVLMIYKVTKFFPKEELFGLVSQMRRSAVSITSNIAEGFGRQSFRVKIQSYSIAQGSLTELQDQITIAKDVGYISEKNFQILFRKATIVHKIITGLIKSTRARLHTS